MGLQETVLMQLRDRILCGKFEPGQHMAEQQLAEQLGASRTPVRAALIALEQEGLVEANEAGKFMVRRFTPGEVADAIAVRGHLEGMAARLVADMQHLRHEDGSYWTGLVFDEGVRWPVERTTWTAAAVVLAVDALAGDHPRSTIFSAITPAEPERETA